MHNMFLKKQQKLATFYIGRRPFRSTLKERKNLKTKIKK